MTIPPEWMPRWRGKSWISRASSSTCSGMPVTNGAVTFWRRHCTCFCAPSRGGGRGSQSICFDQASTWPWRRPQRFAHVPYRRTGPVSDDVGHLGGAFPAITAVDVLDGFFPAVALDVDVDIGRAIALGRQEPLEQQAEAHRVRLGHPERVADSRIGGRPPPLAINVSFVAKIDDVPDDEEIAGETELVDHVELVVDLRVSRGGCLAPPGGRNGGGHLLRSGAGARSSPCARAGWGRVGAAAPPA